MGSRRRCVVTLLLLGGAAGSGRAAGPPPQVPLAAALPGGPLPSSLAAAAYSHADPKWDHHTVQDGDLFHKDYTQDGPDPMRKIMRAKVIAAERELAEKRAATEEARQRIREEESRLRDRDGALREHREAAKAARTTAQEEENGIPGLLAAKAARTTAQE